MAIKNEIVDELLKGVDPKKVFSSEGLLAEIKKALAERMLNAELDQHLEGEAAASEVSGEPSSNHRNGYSKKTVITDTSQIELEIPRDRRGTFEPQLIAKHQLSRIGQIFVRQMQPAYSIAIRPEMLARINRFAFSSGNRCSRALTNSTGHRCAIGKKNHVNPDTGEAFAFDGPAKPNRFVVRRWGNN